jgi:hypothetical protein
MASNTPFPGVQTRFPIQSGTTDLGEINLSKTQLLTPPPPDGGAQALDGSGTTFPEKFKHIAFQVERELAKQNQLLFDLNSLWYQFTGDVPTFIRQNASSFSQFATSALALRKLLLSTTSPVVMKWPLVPVTSVPSDPYCSKEYRPIDPPGNPMAGAVTFVSDQESGGASAESWGFITDYTLVLEEVRTKKDPSSSSSYYSAKATYPGV